MGYARTVKAGTAAAAAVLVAAGLRMVGPAAAGFVAEEIPRAQAAAVMWLTPPYLYLVINAIIISIAASSRYQPTHAPHAAVGAAEATTVSAPALAMPIEVTAPAVAMATAVPMEEPAPAVSTAMAVPVPEAMEVPVPLPEARVPEAAAVQPPAFKMAPAAEVQGEEDFLISRSAWTPQRKVTGAEKEVAPFGDLTNSRKKPLSSGRFGRKAAKPSPEGTLCVFFLPYFYSVSIWLSRTKNGHDFMYLEKALSGWNIEYYHGKLYSIQESVILLLRSYFSIMEDLHLEAPPNCKPIVTTPKYYFSIISQS